MLDTSNKEMAKLLSRLEKGEESEAPGLMEQWLREKKLSEEEIAIESAGSFGAGVDTVQLSWLAGHTPCSLHAPLSLSWHAIQVKFIISV